MSSTKFYDILGILKDASDNDIKRAYKKSALKYHPDRNPNNKEEAENKFKEIGKAYSVLSDPQKKQIYDQFGEDALNGDGGQPGMSPFDIFEQMFSGGGHPFPGGHPFSGGHPFGGMFGGGDDNRRSRKPEHTKKIIKITFKEMMLGGERVENHKRKIIENINDVDDCLKCNGKGKINKIIQMGPGMISQSTQHCGYCNGQGKIAEFKEINEKISFYIKPGTKKGDHLVISEKGDGSIHNNKSGDLIIIFEEEQHSNMQRQNNDLVCLKQILLSESLCGLEYIFKHPSKENILIKSDDIIKPNDIKVLYGLGFPSKNNYRNGNLVIKFDVIFPDSIDLVKKDLILKLLPKRTKLKNINNIDVYTLEPFSNKSSNVESDDNENENRQQGVQCAQQ